MKKYTHISIPIGTGPNEKENIIRIEDRLKNKGIYFEAEWSYPMGSFITDRREWECDWSMCGDKANKVLNVLRKNKVKFSIGW